MERGNEGDGDEDQNLMCRKKKKNFEKVFDENHAKEDEIVVKVEEEEEEEQKISNGSDLIAELKQIDQLEEEKEKDGFEELSNKEKIRVKRKV
ncbi:hypothetical protein V2J09_020753 [Rumex salicifolius]